MTVYVDTRQKANKHVLKHKQIEDVGITLIPKMLKIGDYMCDLNDSVSVDTKQDLNEVYSNLINDKSRFSKEIRRAYYERVKLYILVEHGKEITCTEDIINWSSKFGRVSGRDLYEKIRRLEMSYGVKFVFCDKRNTGIKIIELLTEG